MPGPMLAARIFSRGWVEVGPDGVRFGRWFRRAGYAWDAIESFAVGNPGAPRFAYVVVRAADSATPPRTSAVRLPKLFSVPPAELVATLETKRRIFAVGPASR